MRAILHRKNGWSMEADLNNNPSISVYPTQDGKPPMDIRYREPMFGPPLFEPSAEHMTFDRMLSERLLVFRRLTSCEPWIYMEQ